MTMMQDCLQLVADTLTAAGVQTTPDPQALNLPGAWLVPNTLDTAIALSGNRADVAIDVYLITSNLGASADMKTLDHMAGIAGPALDITTWVPAAISLANQSPDQLPALKGSCTIEWRK